MLAPHVAHDGLVHGVAGDPERARLHHVALGEHGDVGGAAADVDHHERRRPVDRQPRAQRGRHRLLDQVDLARARRDRRLVDRAPLDRRGAGRHADQDARPAEAQHGLGARDELAQHLLGGDEVGDDAVAHGPHELDAARASCPAWPWPCRPDGQHLALPPRTCTATTEGSSMTRPDRRRAGIIIDEPSMVAVVSRSGRREVLAVGLKAKGMQTRKPPERIEIIRPLRDGVIADFIATEEMLRQFISRAKTMLGFRRPRILICVPAGATPVERRAVYETALSAGARRVYIIEEPVAAALGAGLPIDGPAAFMVVDIGGGTTDIAVLAEGNVVQARSLKVAGNAMDEAIMRHVRRKHHLVIGEINAERIKIEAGTALVQPNGRQVEIHIKGRDLREGRTKEVVLTPADLAEALTLPVKEMAEFIRRALEDLPPQVAAEVIGRPIA